MRRRNAGASFGLARLAAAAMLAVVGSALPAAARAELPHFEFKGIRLTDTLAAHRAEFTGCEQFYHAKGCSPRDDRVGDTLMRYYYFFFADDGSGIVHITGHFGGSDYRKMSSAFEMKWGKPAFAAISTVQNGFGATLEIETDRWDFAEGSMTLLSRSDEIHGFLSQMEFLSLAEKARRDDRAKPKVDF